MFYLFNLLNWWKVRELPFVHVLPPTAHYGLLIIFVRVVCTDVYIEISIEYVFVYFPHKLVWYTI